MEIQGTKVPCRRRHGRLSRATFFVDGKELLLGRFILVPCGVYVDDTKSDPGRKSLSRFVRGPVNPVKDGGLLTTLDLDSQDPAFLVFRACVFQGLRWIRTTLPTTLPPSIFRPKSTSAGGGLVVNIWRMTDLFNRVTNYWTWTPRLLSCLHPIIHSL